jgi:hypothetical protein
MKNSDRVELVPPAVAPAVAGWLRLEGLAVVVLSAVLYGQTGTSWWWFAGLWLVPDLSMLGYLAGPRVGSYCYNTAHTYLLPVTLAVCALGLHRVALVPYALIWCNHIGLDRLMGYGLKYPAGFGLTHLSRLPTRLPK